MMYVIRCMGFANGAPCDVMGALLMSYDPEFMNGLGIANWTRDPKRALLFKDAGDAWALWAKTSVIKPLRPDGRPNRPLTAYHVDIGPLEVK